MNSIVLVTDFGLSSPYVAEMKGAILSVSDTVRIVDGTHAIPPQNILQGALVLKQLATSFPAGTIFVAVVDPGVGTNRRILLVENQNRRFIAPDNGLLSFLFENARIQSVDQEEYWRAKVSVTFHGRDIMGPVAGHLSNGIPSSKVSTPITDELVHLDLPHSIVDKDGIVGEIIFADSFGNLVTNISQDELQPHQRTGSAQFAGKSVPLVATYADAEVGSPIALFGSTGLLEIAITNASADEYFQAKIGDRVEIRAQ